MIPKRLFLFWESGFEEAPPIVRVCRDSWRYFNPDFEIVELSESSLHEWLDLDAIMSNWRDLPIQKLSNLVRLALLHEHGGVWADATLFCTRPLSAEVLRESALDLAVLDTTKEQSGRTIHSFFLASSKGNEMMRAWLNTYISFLSSGVHPLTQGSMRRWRRRRPYLFRTFLGTLFWTSPLVGRHIGYPYLIMHYQVNRLLLTNRAFRKGLRRAGHFSAGEALRLSLEPRGGEIFAQQLRSSRFPLWKLSWRTELTPEFWETVRRECVNFLEGSSQTV